MGMRTTGVQVCPFIEVLITMSLLEHPARNRQSFHTVYTLPSASTSAEGSSWTLRFPPTEWAMMEETGKGPWKLVPPSCETKEFTAPSDPLSIGITTVPSGFTTGCPPTTLAPGTEDAGQVRPPSDDRETCSWLPVLASSHSV